MNRNERDAPTMGQRVSGVEAAGRVTLSYRLRAADDSRPLLWPDGSPATSLHALVPGFPRSGREGVIASSVIRALRRHLIEERRGVAVVDLFPVSPERWARYVEGVERGDWWTAVRFYALWHDGVRNGERIGPVTRWWYRVSRKHGDPLRSVRRVSGRR